MREEGRNWESRNAEVGDARKTSTALQGIVEKD